MRKSLVLAAAFLSLAPVRAQVENSRRLFTQIEPILQGLSEITGMKIKHKVPADYISKPKLQQFIQQRVDEAVKPEDVRIESMALKMFGFLPPDYDLKKVLVDLMTEQAAAFYDYDRKKLYITESDSSFLEKRAALVHELAHALADQNFSLGKYLRKGTRSDDAATAREAVTEGQATWLMWAYVSKLGGGEAVVPDAVLESMTGAAAAAVSSQYPVFANAPLYMRQSLTFPYTAGLEFQNALTKRLGKQGFSEVYRRPPVSTQQILHPQLYLDGQQPLRVTTPKPPKKGYRQLTEGTVGELDFQILLEQYAGAETAGKIAPHWRGGEYAVYESKRGKKPLLTFAVEWDSPETAREFLAAYRTVLEKKWQHPMIREEAQGYSGVGDTGGFITKIEGTRVESVEGLPESR